MDLSDRQREVTLLEGQALFRVAKDRHRPFVVRAGDAQVRAIGTEFDVYRKQVATIVTVVEGRVETYDASDSAGGTPVVAVRGRTAYGAAACDDEADANGHGGRHGVGAETPRL